MTVWRSRGHRGDALEELILLTIEYYRVHKLARIDKVSIPIKVIEIDQRGIITRAFFEKKSTVDFHGIIQGVGVAFDVKETQLKSLPFKNIHAHQIEFMADINEQKGLAFLIVHFIFCDEYYLLPYEIIDAFVTKNHRQSIPYKEMLPEYQIPRPINGILNFLPILNTYVSDKANGRFLSI